VAFKVIPVKNWNSKKYWYYDQFGIHLFWKLCGY